MRFLVIIFVAAGLVIGYFKFQDWRKDKEDRHWVSLLQPHLGKFTGGSAGKKPASSLPDEAGFFQLLHFLHKAENARVDIGAMIASTCTELGVSENAAGLVKDSLMANYDMAKKLHILDDLDNTINLERGEPAVIMTPGWLNDKAVVGQVVSPLYAPEAAQSMPNLLLMPASVRDAMDQKPTEFTMSRATVFERNQIITSESLKRLKIVREESK